MPISYEFGDFWQNWKNIKQSKKIHDEEIFHTINCSREREGGVITFMKVNTRSTVEPRTRYIDYILFNENYQQTSITLE